MERKYFNTINDLITWNRLRELTRITHSGFINARLKRIKLGQLKSLLNKLQNDIENPDTFKIMLIEKEIEFRQVFMNFKQIFIIDIK